jgi:hypothetical protein
MVMTTVAAGRADVHPPLGVVVQQRRGHLAAPGVVDAHEQHLRDLLDDGPFGLGQGAEPLTAEAVHEQGDEVDHPGPGHAVDRLVDEALDRLQREDAAELLVQGLDGAGERLAADRVHCGAIRWHGPASSGNGGTAAAGRGRLAVDGAAAGRPVSGGAGQAVEVGGQQRRASGWSR